MSVIEEHVSGRCFSQCAVLLFPVQRRSYDNGNRDVDEQCATSRDTSAESSDEIQFEGRRLRSNSLVETFKSLNSLRNSAVLKRYGRLLK